MQVFPDLNTVIANIASTIEAFRAASLPVIHVHHASLVDSPLNPTICPAGFPVLPEAAPVGDEVVFIKNVNSGFIGTGLEAHLRAAQIDTLVILGLTTSHCVSTTTRMAENLGWKVFLPRDGTAMFECAAAPGNQRRFDAETMHEVALAELHEEFATVVTTEEIIASVKESSNVE
ncbi:Isochorismatase-like protein [Mycena sp. CBHHK59/15]|nr:Isochorismatase-like protein [Mycena sp. CBHHK59/15]